MNLEKGDYILLQRTEFNKGRVPMFLDNKWVIIAGFNTHGKPYTFTSRNRYRHSTFGKRRSFQYDDIKAIARRRKNIKNIQEEAEKVSTTRSTRK
jgi:hypothetical protein